MMNTITKGASTNVIVAVDLGKYKSVACVHSPTTGELRFTTFETTRIELRKLVVKEQPAVAVIKVCLMAGWVHDLCGELGVRCLVANTASLFVAQGLSAPRGAKAWSATGLAGIAIQAKTLGDCGPDELYGLPIVTCAKCGQKKKPAKSKTRSLFPA
jgi:hypothetical protein